MKTNLRFTSTAVATLLLFVISSSYAHHKAGHSNGNGNANPAHCAQHQDPGMKIEVGDVDTTLWVPDAAGNLVEVEIDLSGADFSITPTDPALHIDDADWCIKAGREVESGDGVFGMTTIANHRGQPRNISYIVVYSVTMGNKCADREEELIVAILESTGNTGAIYEGKLFDVDNTFCTLQYSLPQFPSEFIATFDTNQDGVREQLGFLNDDTINIEVCAAQICPF